MERQRRLTLPNAEDGKQIGNVIWGSGLRPFLNADEEHNRYLSDHYRRDGDDYYFSQRGSVHLGKRGDQHEENGRDYSCKNDRLSFAIQLVPFVRRGEIY
jgi:hypothetical protein